MGIHSHSHQGNTGHHHTHEAPHSLNKAFAIAIAITSAYILAEVIYAFMANSMSLLADAVHNLGDVLGLVLAWIANWLLSIPARKRYSYGFKRTTIIAALANAFILVATSALIAYESVFKLIYLTDVNEDIVIVIGIIGVFVNAGCSLLFMRGARDDINIKGAFLHLVADALILVGVVIGAVLIKYTGILWIDPVLGLIIVGIVLWGTWGLLRDSVSLILDAIPHYIDYAGVKDYLNHLPGVKAVHDFHIWGLSTKEVALTAHLVMPEKPLTDADYKKINHELHDKFRVNHVTLQVESGSDDDPCLRREKC
ncbi:cation diffusion facilitator family transporter [Aquicella lusitana]|uniref:Cobalt-zinc-cadmium efflux system protein n=1 Tax=Aquicella lusitana TaxID=254246 RepID=A0A370GWB1_9COXI|nr:cation diffusion facilitator family transporter [Aquicella lusitana]RDI46884.1 cobalt-zinc-cadmium efflux system protein [Aquicella lusitana]VVC73775.1 Metal cation efflux system protein CzcD [Aquicella lusitana]